MITPESIAEILGLGTSVRSLQDLESAVSAGLPKRSLERLSARLYPEPGMANAYKYEVVPRTTWNRRAQRLSLVESQRTERVARILASAEHILDDREQAREWMSKTHLELDDQTPLEAARSELGARRVEAVLERLFFGLPI